MLRRRKTTGRGLYRPQVTTTAPCVRAALLAFERRVLTFASSAISLLPFLKFRNT
jgi:hypothetical protein